VIFFAHGAQKLLGWFGGMELKDTMRTMHQSLGPAVIIARGSGALSLDHVLYRSIF
jgi:uncharacterized membrane protein YphA (DoxX/SURF4 family)